MTEQIVLYLCNGIVFTNKKKQITDVHNLGVS